MPNRTRVMAELRHTPAAPKEWSRKDQARKKQLADNPESEPIDNGEESVLEEAGFNVRARRYLDE